MNPTPENSSSSKPRASSAGQARRELTPEERALLPDFTDEVRVGGQTRAPSLLMAAQDAPDPKAAPGDRNALLGGALGGCFGNIVLGFVLLSFERAGLSIYGPGALAIVLGFTLLFLLARQWPRRVILSGVAFGISLVLSYGMLYLLVRPTLNSINPSALPDVPPDQTGNPALQAPEYAPQALGADNS